MIDRVNECWKNLQIAGALSKNIKVAFNHTFCTRYTQKMPELGFDK